MSENNEILKQLTFNIGWRTSIQLMIFGKTQSTTLLFSSASKNIPVSEIQLQAYDWFMDNQDKLFQIGFTKIQDYVSSIRNDVEPYLIGTQKINDLSSILTLSMIQILPDGTLGVLFENSWDDNGVVILRKNKKVSVGPQLIMW